jgi:hypothetical protein
LITQHQTSALDPFSIQLPTYFFPTFYPSLPTFKMYFAKAVISLLAVAGFAAAQDPNLARREAFELAREEYLVARDEYIEQRDLFLRKEKPQKVLSP